jgi:DNA-binding response OmpR family regulator
MPVTPSASDAGSGLGLSIRERFLEVGFDGYVSKPLATSELVAEVRRVLGLSGEIAEDIHE